METLKPVNILLVDDNEDNLFALGAVLRSPEYFIVSASSGAQALENLADRDFAVVLLDVQMPGMDGLETARRIRSLERSTHTPIILVTGVFPDEEHIRQGYDVGAVDFVSKPFDPRIMKCKVAIFAELFRKGEKIREQEKLLHEASEIRFRTLFEQSPLGIQLYSPEGRCVEANRSWEKIWGELACKFKEINALCDGEAGDELPTRIAIQKALKGEPSELPPALSHGKWIKSFVYPVRGERGVIREAAVIVQDVSEQKTVEEELRSSRDQLRIIFERVADGIVVHDRSFRAVYANDVGARMMGFESVDSFLGRSAFDAVLGRADVFDQDGRPLDLERFPTRQAMRGEHPAPESTICFREKSTGKATWLIIASRPILDESGNPYLAVTIYRDVTEQRRKENNDRFLSAATAILASSLDYLSTLPGIAALAVEVVADWCNITLADEQGVLRPVATRHHDRELNGLAELTAQRYVARPEAKRGSPWVYRTGSSLIMNELSDEALRDFAPNADHFEKCKILNLRAFVFVPIRAHDKILGTIGLAFAGKGRSFDSLDLVLAEELGRRVGMAIENASLYHEAQEQKDRLQKAVQARDEFISIASHELKTPVTSLILHAEMAALQLHSNDPDDEIRARIAKYVKVSSSQLDRLSRLIEEMLDVSRIGSGKLSMQFEALDLVRLVRGVLGDFAEQIQNAGSSCEFTAEGPIPIRCDRYRIEQVVTNLLTNAIKYGEGRPIRVSLRSEGVRAVLVVRDEGRGISPEDHQRIFGRFERAVSVSSSSGLGLGLYIVKQIVLAHGGAVSVESELGHGATFRIDLPVIAGTSS